MIFWSIYFLILAMCLFWVGYTGACLRGYIKYKYRIVLLDIGLYQPQSLELWGWEKVLTTHHDGYENEHDAQDAILLDIEWYRKKYEINRRRKILKVIPYKNK